MTNPLMRKGGTHSDTKDKRLCPACDGVGEVRIVAQNPWGEGTVIDFVVCESCKGQGEI